MSIAQPRPLEALPVEDLSTVRRLRAFLGRPIRGTALKLVLGIVLLNLVDGFTTLRHLDHGAEELNPLMCALLRYGAGPFVVVKHLLASLGVLGIAVYSEVRAGRIALYLLFPLYLAIAIYQLTLLAIIR